MSNNYWEHLDKFEKARNSGNPENPGNHSYPRSKTDFCRPLDSRGKRVKKDVCPSGAYREEA